MFGRQSKTETTPVFSGHLHYRFIDASVPPEYHRSYTITVSHKHIHLTVDAYGSIIKDQVFPISSGAFQRFITTLGSLNISKKTDNLADRCTGGKTDKLDIQTDNMCISGYVYHCAGTQYGNLEGDVEQAINLFKDLLPGLQQKLRV